MINSDRQLISKTGEINKLLTHAITINLVPFVLKETCFVGLHLNTSGKPSKRRNSKGVKLKCAKEINGKAHLHIKTGPSTIGGAT